MLSTNFILISNLNEFLDQWLRSPGTFLRKSLDEGVTMEVVQANWNNICSLDPRKHDLPKSAFDSASRIMEGLEAIENGVGTIAEEDVTKENLTEYKIPNTFYEYVAKDAMLYALSGKLLFAIL